MTLEKLLTPLKINPMNLISIGAGSLLMYDHLTSPSDDLFTRLIQVLGGIGLTAPFISFYIFSAKNYISHKRSLENHGFREIYATKAIKQHCSRQPFYLACKQKGFEKEFNELYEKEKNKVEFPFIPMI